ncbi:MAG: hypothetical protein IPP72_19370 [Chitinophagaceae bacterium]|nr:hypothetical protein [Chitinophagaceae bacterium]
MKQLKQPSKKATVNQQLKSNRLTSKLLVLLIFVMGFTSMALSQTTFTSVQNGMWNDPDTWDMGAVPTSADDVVIGNGITVQISSEGEACRGLVIGTGDGSGSGAIAFSGTSSLTVTDVILLGDINGATGTITMDADATLTCGSIEEGDPLYSGIYETNSGTIVFNGTFTLPYNLFQFNNLVVNGGTLSTAGRNLPIEGNLTINNGATLDLGPNTANRNTIAGTLAINNGGTLRIGGGGTIPANFNTHVIGATSTIEYYGVAQTVATLNSSQNYGYLVISGSGLKEVNGSIGIARDLTVNSGIFSVNTFTANRTSAGGTLTVANGATLRIAGSGTLPSSFSTHIIGATSTIEYSGTGSQNIAVLNSAQKYGNLNVYNSVKTLAGNVTVAGTITFAGTPNKLIIGSNTLTLEGAIAGSLTNSRNFSGSSSGNMVMNGAFNRTLYFDATTIGTTNVLNNLTINHSGNVSTLGNDLVVNNNITFTAGKLAIAARTLTVKGNLVNTITEGIKGGSSSKLIFNGSVSPVLSMDQTTPGTTNVLSTLQVNSNGQVITMGNDLQMAGTLTFTSGKLAINGNTLTLKGSVTNTASGGIRAGNSSNLIINGTVSTALSFDQSTPGTTNVINNLTVNSSGQTITLSNALRLEGTHIPTAGVFSSGGNYSIASSSSATANIAAGSTSGGYITGDVTVERYIPQNVNRGWRLLASPTSGQTIHEAWQENQSAGVDGNPGYGTNITTRSASWSADGFDFQTANHSLYSYDAANDELLPVMSTSGGIASEPGYFIYIRGGRNVTPSSSISSVNSTILRTKGTLKTGNQSAVSVSADKFGMIGNPFASAIDLRNITTSGGCTGTSFYVWDPKLMGAYSLGAYQTLTPSGGNFIVIPGGGSYGSGGTVVNSIQSGAAFLVQATGSAGTITINESSKASGSVCVFRPGGVNEDRVLMTTLYAVTGGGNNLADGNMVVFNDSYTNTIDGLDSRKQFNFGENIWIIKNNTTLAVERRNAPTGNDTIQFSMSGLKNMSYQLQILGDHLTDNGLLPFLEDKYLNSATLINLYDTTFYTFTVNSNAGSFAENRFRIVFKTAGILPVTFTTVTAGQQGSKIAVKWRVDNQLNIRDYQVERSLNGIDFTKVAVVPVFNSSSFTYYWLDENPVSGANYYRIKSIGADEKTAYSKVVKVLFREDIPALMVSPNPVTGNVMSLQFANQVRGNYKIRLVNNAGQPVFSKTIMYEGGNSIQSVTLPANILNGAYQLR